MGTSTIEIPEARAPRGGYASFSKFIASDKALCTFRRFDSLAIRNLLYMQDEICMLEQQLSDIDEADMTSNIYVNIFHLHSRRYDKNEKRVALMREIAAKLKTYEKTLLRRSSLLALQKPLDSDVTSLSNWMNGKNPVIKEESHFLDIPADLSRLASQDPRNVLETFLERYCCKLFVTSNHRSKPHAISDPAYVRYYSSTTIRRVARLITTFAAVAIITGPNFALYYVTPPTIRLALVVAFALIFAIILAMTTTCKNQEVFAIVAAYSAVLIVFVGNQVGNPGPSQSERG